MASWVPSLKDFIPSLWFGGIFFAVQAVRSFHKRHQMQQSTQRGENVSPQCIFLRNGIAQLVISLLLFVFSCGYEAFSSVGAVTLLVMLAISLLGVCLLSALLILVEKSQFRSQP